MRNVPDIPVNPKDQIIRRRMLRIIAWALLAFAVLGLGRVVWDLRLGMMGVIADGIVTQIEIKHTSGGAVMRRAGELESDYQSRRRRKESTTQYATVRFTPAGGEPRDFKTVCTFGRELKKGDAVKVIHLASDPGVAEIYSAKQLWLPIGVGTVVSLLCGGGGWLLLGVARRN